MSRTTIILVSVLFLSSCGGSDSDSITNPVSSNVSVRVSDAPVDSASNVVVTVDSMTFRRSNGDEIVVDTFTSTELGLIDAQTFTVDLLEVQGSDNRLVLDSVELPVGSYSDLRLDILDENTSLSYVIEVEGGNPKDLKVPSGELKLGAFNVSALSTQTFVIEFGLRQSLTYNPGPDRYILKPRGVRVVELESASAIVGTVDLATAYGTTACEANENPESGNVVYVYSGHGLDVTTLSDDADPEVDTSINTERLNVPLASATIDEAGLFDISYIPSGDYTVAFSCLAGDDQPDTVENIVIPAPDTDVVEVSLASGEQANCGFVSGTPPVCLISSAQRP